MAKPPCPKCGKKMKLISSTPNHADKINNNVYTCEPCDEHMELVGKYDRKGK